VGLGVGRDVRDLESGVEVKRVYIDGKRVDRKPVKRIDGEVLWLLFLAAVAVGASLGFVLLPYLNQP
jgi:hypothetical protein